MKRLFTKRYILLLVVLATSIWGYASNSKTFYSKATATALPSDAAGKVYVSNSENSKGSSAVATYNTTVSKDNTSDEHTYYFTAETTNSGYTWVGWYDTKAHADAALSTGKQNSGGTTCQASVSANSTSEDSPTTVNRYARWTPNPYTITLNNQSADIEGTKTISVTFDASTNLTSAITKPQKKYHIFQGYYTSQNNDGLQLIDADGYVKASVSGYTDANKKWKYAGSPTIYAKWLEKATPKVTCASTTFTVQETINNVFTFTNTSNISCEIINVQIDPLNNGNGKVVEYDAANNKLITHNAGTATIRFTQAETGTIKPRVININLTIERRTPTFSWRKFTNIYAGDTLQNVAQAKYNSNNVSGLTYSYVSRNTTYVVVEGTTLRIPTTGYTVADSVRIVVSTEETPIYKAAKDSIKYYIEPKKTARFYVNGKQIIGKDTTLNLLIGQTANMSFAEVDESKFSYTENPEYITYSHNSSDHTGVLTATEYGVGSILFHQGGSDTHFEVSRTVNVNVYKHPVEISTTMNAGVWKVDSVFDGTIYSLSDTPEGTEPAQNAVTATAKSDTVLQFVDGHWKAVGAGKDTLIFAQSNNDYWTGDTLKVVITVEKYDPVFDWSGLRDTLNFNTLYKNPVTSSFTGNHVTYVSNKAAVVVVNDTMLRTATTADNAVTITAKQKGNYKFNDRSESKTVKVLKLRNHVEVNVTSSETYSAVYAGKSGEVAWDGKNGIRLGGSSTKITGGPAYDWSDKYIDIKFEGIPSKISFTTGLTSSAATSTVVWPGSGSSNGFWYMIEYPEGESANTIWTESSSNNPGTITKDLKPNTNKVRICYTGNFAGYVKNLKITERTEINVSKTTVDFGEADASSDPTNKNITIDWYNVNPLTLTIEGNNESQFTVSPATIESSKDSYDKNVALTLAYMHNRAAVKDTSTLVITDGTITKRIGLKGVTNKVTPEITWKENLTPMQRGVGVKNPATSPVALSYSSTDATVVDVIGDSIVPLKKGEAQIIASFDGTNDPVYNSNSKTIDVVVTDVKVQHINWTQNFKRLKWTDDATLSSKNTPDFPLVATVSYYDPDKDEEITINRPITYTSNNTNVVQVLNDTILHVVGTGNTTLEAHVEGIADSLYEATAIREVIVREPSLDCDIYVLENASCKMTTGITDFSGTEQTFSLSGEPGYLTFSAWREAIKVGIEYTGGKLFVAQKVGSDWIDLVPDGLELEKNNSKDFGPYALNRNAREIKFYKKTGATGHHLVSSADVTLARYVEFEDGQATKSIAYTTEDAKPGVAKEKTFKVNYSNITDQLEFEFKGGENSKFSVVSPSAIGTECGDYGQATVKVQFMSNDVDTYKDTLLIKNLNQSLSVYLQAEVDKHHQQITWNPATTELKTTDNVTFDATTTGSAAGLSVRYSVTEGDAATVSATTGVLTIIKDGTVTVQADADGDGVTYYDAEPVSKTFSISKVKSAITTAPTAAEMTLPNTNLADCALSNGAANVEGSFDWDDKTIDATYNNSGYKVVFTPQNTNWYDTASCVVVVPVSKKAQTITWNFDVTEMYCNATYAFTGDLAATASSGLAVRYETSNASIAYVDDAKNLRIIKGGEVTITAYQDGNDTYAAAESVAKTITIKRFAPTIVELPEAAPMKIGRNLSDASFTGGKAELNGVIVEGVFAWVNGNTTQMNEAGTFSKQIVFAPANKNYYDSVYTMMNVEVEKYAPVIAQTLQGSAITYGQALNQSNLSGSVTATDTIKLPHATVAGGVVWKNASTTYPAAGEPSHATAIFVPENTDWYNEVEIENVPLTVNKAAATYTATTTIVYGQRLSEANLENTTTGVFSEAVSGSVAWADAVNQDEVLAIGSHNVAIRFTSESDNYTDGDGICVVTVLEGVVFKGGTNTSWGEGDNWQAGNTPDTNDRVTVDADVEITGDVTIGGLTINEGYTLTVKDGATLTIGAQDSYLRNVYGNIHVENGGQLVCGSGEVKVNNFFLDAQLGSTVENYTSPSASGQVNGADNLIVNGDAYFQLELDPSGHNTYGWYDFVVPFEVDVIGGISIAEDPTASMKFNVNYAVMSYDEAKRAVNGKDWNKFSGTMEPGRVYTITLDDELPWNTVVFKKKKGAPIAGDRSFTTSYSGLGAAVDNGWNGFGNGSLRHMELDVPEETVVQIYDHTNKCYQPRPAKDMSIAVGLSFFIQVDGVQTIALQPAEGNSAFLAPRRVRESADKFRLALTAEGANNASDYLWVSASEDATGAYVIGRDVLKMGTMTSSKVARMWSSRNNINLCSNEMVLVNDNAECEISLFAPKAESYTLDIERAPEDATLYLTYNGNIIWDLTASPYTFDLAKGTTTGYGLRMEINRTPAIMTGVENAETNSRKARKVVIDDKLYIITPEGAMYNVSGKIVR